MTKVYEGGFDGQGLRAGIVVSRFNDLITTRLLDGALDRLRRSNVSEDAIDVCWVPGAFEVSKAARVMATSGKYDGIIALAAVIRVIRGSTPHFDMIASEITKGLARVNLDTIDQAIERAGTKMGNKGSQAAETMIEMANLLKEL